MNHADMWGKSTAGRRESENEDAEVGLSVFDSACLRTDIVGEE